MSKLKVLLKRPEDLDSLKVEVTEAYVNYQPPVDAAATTRRLISYVDPKHMAGLKRIVLTNASGAANEKNTTHLGCYIEQSKNASAWIEIFVDRIFDQWPALSLKIPFFRELALAETIYHEVGHHIQIGIFKGNYKKEAIAEEWEGKLSGSYATRRLWYLFPLFYAVSRVSKAYRAVKRGLRARRRA